MASEEKNLSLAQDPDDIDDFDHYDDDEDFVQENKYLTFGVESEIYGISLLEVVEIIRMMPITPIPQTHEFIKGIINLRGKIIPIMDVRVRFSLEEKAYEERTCIIVVSVEDHTMGLIVDHVAEVLEIPEEKVEQVNGVSSSGAQRFVKGIGKLDSGVKILLDAKEMIINLSDAMMNKAA